MNASEALRRLRDPRTQVVTTADAAAALRLRPDALFGGFDRDARTGAKLATAEKALFDLVYLSGTRSRRFRCLPELGLPPSFRAGRLRSWIRRIGSERMRSVVSRGLLEIAGLLAARRAELRRRVLIVFFDGEELGLLGSKHYAGAPRVPLNQTVAMLNLDMVGRLEKNHLMVGGTGTSPIWAKLLHELNKASGKFKLTLWPGGRAPSDHTSFYEKDIPVLFFFTGLHSDYHRPTDDWKTLEYKGHERVARFTAEVEYTLASAPATSLQ